ncbi:uncharacterized protein [Oncorhynchus clarkii lewisi]|uniref:uncharacterized protein n=1 Tax=Oncorhynchus clarkii lewisi TaxID=490388 RepID=UPI0039B8FBC0
MEHMDSPASHSNDPNGFVNKVFNVSLDVQNETGTVSIQETGKGEGHGEGPGPGQAQREWQEAGDRQADTQAPPQTPGKERPEVNRRTRATGGIWKILTRRRVASELDNRRPHSMILPGEEAFIPKLSFADKVRSIKKLRSPGVFKGRVGKMSGSSTKFRDGEMEDDSFCRDFLPSPGLHPCRSTLRHRAKRHSYAGHTAEFDCSFEDIDLTATLDRHHLHSLVEPPTQNGSKPTERISYSKRPQVQAQAQANHSSNCNSTSAGVCEEQSVRGSPKVQLGGKRSKRADVWSYLRRISVLGKGNPAYSERSFDSELHTLDKTMDSDYGSVDFESVRDFQPVAPKHSDSKGGHFGGLIKFFSNVAETARKWRTSSRSFSPPEEGGERSLLGSPRAGQHLGDYVQSVSLTLRSEDHPECPPTPASPLTPHPPRSPACDPASPPPLIGRRSPQVMLKAWRVSPDSPSVDGLVCVTSLETDRQMDRQTERQTDRQTDRQTERQTRHTSVATRQRVCLLLSQSVSVTEAEGVSVTEAEGVSVTEAEGVSVTEAEGVSVTEAEGVSVTEAEGVYVTEAEGVSVTEAEDVSVTEAEGVSVTEAEGVSVTEAEALVDLRVCSPFPEGCVFAVTQQAKGGSLCRHRRRPGPMMHLSPGQRRTGGLARPCSVIEPSVTMEIHPGQSHRRFSEVGRMQEVCVVVQIP